MSRSKKLDRIGLTVFFGWMAFCAGLDIGRDDTDFWTGAWVTLALASAVLLIIQLWDSEVTMDEGQR